MPTKTIPIDRNKIKEHLRNKAFDKIDRLFSKTKKVKDKNDKQYLETLQTLCKVVKNSINNTNENIKIKYLQSLIEQIKTLAPSYKENVYEDVLDLLFDTLLILKHEMIIEYFPIFIYQFTQVEKYLPAQCDTIDNFFISQLYKKVSEAWKQSGNHDLARKFADECSVLENECKTTENKQISQPTIESMSVVNDPVLLEKVSVNMRLTMNFTSESEEKDSIYENKLIDSFQDLGEYLVKTKDYPQAVLNYTVAMNIAKESKKLPYLYLISLLYRANVYLEIAANISAIFDLRTVLAHPSFNVLLNDSNKDKVIPLVENICDYDKWEKTLLTNLISNHFDIIEENINVYLEVYKKFKRNNIQQKTKILLCLHKCLLKLKKYKEALGVIDEVSLINPNIGSWPASRAEINIEMGDFAEAYTNLKKAENLFCSDELKKDIVRMKLLLKSKTKITENKPEDNLTISSQLSEKNEKIKSQTTSFISPLSPEKKTSTTSGSTIAETLLTSIKEEKNKLYPQSQDLKNKENLHSFGQNMRGIDKFKDEKLEHASRYYEENKQEAQDKLAIKMIELLQESVQNCIINNKFSEAIVHLDTAIQKAKGKFNYLYLINLLYRGHVYRCMGEIVLAIMDFNSVISHSSFSELCDEPNKSKVVPLINGMFNFKDWNNLIQAIIAQKKADSALHCINIYLKIHEKLDIKNTDQQFKIRSFLPRCLLVLKKYDEALSMINLLSSENTNVNWNTLLAEIYIAKKSLVIAKEYLDKAEKISSRDDLKQEIERLKLLLIENMEIKKTSVENKEASSTNQLSVNKKPKVFSSFYIPSKTKQPIEKKPQNIQPKTKSQIKKQKEKEKKKNNSIINKSEISDPIYNAKKERRAAKRAEAQRKNKLALDNREHELQVRAEKARIEKEKLDQEKMIAEKAEKIADEEKKIVEQEKKIGEQEIKPVEKVILPTITTPETNDQPVLKTKKQRRAAKRAESRRKKALANENPEQEILEVKQLSEPPKEAVTSVTVLQEEKDESFNQTAFFETTSTLMNPFENQKSLLINLPEEKIATSFVPTFSSEEIINLTTSSSEEDRFTSYPTSLPPINPPEEFESTTISSPKEDSFTSYTTSLPPIDPPEEFESTTISSPKEDNFTSYTTSLSPIDPSEEFENPILSSPKEKKYNSTHQMFYARGIISSPENKTLPISQRARYALLRPHIMTTTEFNSFGRIMNALDPIQIKKVTLSGSSQLVYFMASKQLISFYNDTINIQIKTPLAYVQEINNILLRQGLHFTISEKGYNQFNSKKPKQSWEKSSTERNIEITLVPEEITVKDDNFIDIMRSNLDVIKYVGKHEKAYHFTFNETTDILEDAFNNKAITFDLSKNTKDLFYHMIEYSEHVKGTLHPQCIINGDERIKLNEQWDNPAWKHWLNSYFNEIDENLENIYYKQLNRIIENGYINHSKTNTIFSVFFQKKLGSCKELLVTNSIHLFRSFFNSNYGTLDLKLLIDSIINLVKNSPILSKKLISPILTAIMIHKLLKNKEEPTSRSGSVKFYTSSREKETVTEEETLNTTPKMKLSV